MSLGRVGSAIRVMGCSWLVLLACGGISERRGSDDDNGGSASGGSASTPKGGSASSGHAGSPTAVAGTLSAAAGTSVTTPTSPSNPGPCFNDSDCPGSTCGGDVCNWSKVHERPVADKVYVCNPAGTDPKGQDGWCTSDADCKCLARGAKCVGVRCTFTRPADAPGG